MAQNRRRSVGVRFSTSQEDNEQTTSSVSVDIHPPGDSGNIHHHSEAIEIENSVNLFDENLAEYETLYGQTPPRTRIKNKNRNWERRQSKMEGNVKMRLGGRLARPRADRRNTVDCAILNQMIIEPSADAAVVKRSETKRNSQLIRLAERDSKMSSVVLNVMNNRNSSGVHHEQIDMDNVVVARSAIAAPTTVESISCFKSVESRRMGCRVSAPSSQFPFINFRESLPTDVAIDDDDPLKSRKEFFDTFANCIKLGSDRNTKSMISREDYIWQTEIKDMIWLELQAWHADRTLEQQDTFLFELRSDVEILLEDIMTYKFTRKPRTKQSLQGLNTSDSGFATASTGSEEKSVFCFGCLSMSCSDCLQSQSTALKNVEVLLTRLEAAESLYPSTKAMGQQYPLYRTAQFIGRVKAMCLWYNMTRHLRLKLLILGKMLTRLQGKKYSTAMFETESSSSSAHESEGYESCSRDSYDHTRAVNECKISCKPSVHFIPELEVQSSGDSVNSTISEDGTKEEIEDVQEEKMIDFTQYVNNLTLTNLEPLMDAHFSTNSSSRLASSSPYRKYIEKILKVRGLGKSMSFLHSLHTVLYKAHITLEPPGSAENEFDYEPFEDEDVEIIEPHVEFEQAEELRRFGVWSEEHKQLGLPTYTSAFIFLSLIPLEVIHEFLRMRLETQPQTPNPLSLEQLLKELREGLTLAMIHRDRFHKHIQTALCDRDAEMEKYENILEEFDETVRKVFNIYLAYAEQWVLVAVPEEQRKSALDNEWNFTRLVAPMIVNQHSLAAKKFCSIVESLFNKIGDNLVTRTKQLGAEASLSDEYGPVSNVEIRWRLCRDIQKLFTQSREQCFKVMAFAKTLCRDIEKIEFHRDHNDEQLRNPDNFVCAASRNATAGVMECALLMRERLTATIKGVQERCDFKTISSLDMDEMDKLTFLSRTREILHQGYKFGFEYHKDLYRLFEMRSVVHTQRTVKETGSALILANATIEFAKLWMQFVMERCERGRGIRPRWAAQGLEFLMCACDPLNTRHLAEEQFQKLKLEMNKCISHVVGSISEPGSIRKSPRSRKSSPDPTRAKTPTRSPLPGRNSNLAPRVNTQLSLQHDTLRVTSPNGDYPEFVHKQTSIDGLPVTLTLKVPTQKVPSMELRQVRVRDAVNRLDLQLEEKLRESNLIGTVKVLNHNDANVFRTRSVKFSWHRGIKIGQGGFGKVYTAVNNTTGELMAMKEIPIQPGENRELKRVAEELKIFEGIKHRNLVKYFGVEIHREELLIFMELCAEGTLESLVELSGGLPEGLTRRYTAQILGGVAELHRHGVVHRDIKTANIFLTNNTNCLKLGDFGSAAKIKRDITMPGELRNMVGTQAYMAPEVFTKNKTEGHGRAVDVWSVGCCVIEMASGKRPWYQFDSNFQIMFKVGMGETPKIPDTLSQEGHDFIDLCLQHDPKDRWSADELLQHCFCKVHLDPECTCDSSPGGFRDTPKNSLQRRKNINKKISK